MVDRAGCPDWQPQVAAPGHGLHADLGDVPLQGQAPGGLAGVFGHQGCGPRMSDSVDLGDPSERQPRASASGHGPGGGAEGFGPSTSQPLPHMSESFRASLD
eukprot:8252063-Pyramimonas_sp.AAC.1